MCSRAPAYRPAAAHFCAPVLHLSAQSIGTTNVFDAPWHESLDLIKRVPVGARVLLVFKRLDGNCSLQRRFRSQALPSSATVSARSAAQAQARKQRGRAAAASASTAAARGGGGSMDAGSATSGVEGFVCPICWAAYADVEQLIQHHAVCRWKSRQADATNKQQPDLELAEDVAPTNGLVLWVSVFCGRKLADVQLFGQQDPYAIATVAVQGPVACQAVDSSAHPRRRSAAAGTMSLSTAACDGGGCNPVWSDAAGRRMGFWFASASAIPTSVTIECWNENTAMDSRIGTAELRVGGPALAASPTLREQLAVKRWVPMSTGGAVQCSVRLQRDAPAPRAQDAAAPSAGPQAAAAGAAASHAAGEESSDVLQLLTASEVGRLLVHIGLREYRDSLCGVPVDGSKLCEATDAADVGSALLQGAGMQNERHRTRLLTNARAWRLRGLPDGAKEVDQLSAKKGAWL